MLDFLKVSTRNPKRGITQIYPKFIVRPSSDLMIKGDGKSHFFYAIWDDSTQLWSTDEFLALKLIDNEIEEFKSTFKSEDKVETMFMWDSDSGSVIKWKKFCEKEMASTSRQLDEKLVFANDVTTRKDYASHRLPYPLQPCAIDAYEELINVLYSPEERHKIEWAIGSIVTGESKKNQKFMVLYGSAGTGKSTVLNIIQDLFEGYYCVFDAKALGSNSNAFALEPFSRNPLVAIQHDGDLSRIEDNTRLNSIVSHETMVINEKFKGTYESRFNCFLFMGTNRPVKITDAKSGILRRLIDVSPTGKKVSSHKYKELMARIKFELGGIACHCRDVYLENPGFYDTYVPKEMMGASNDFYNFVYDHFDIFKRDDSISLKSAWTLYKEYCEDAKVYNGGMSMRLFKEELKNYFKDFVERDESGSVVNMYRGFIVNKFETVPDTPKEEPMISMDCTESLLDEMLKDCPAQLTTADGTPLKKWADVKATLKDIKTTELHYVKPPENHIVIDFDLKDNDGNKCFDLNAKAAKKWPPTYAELSKGGQGIHLHYIYDGDPKTLSCVFDKDIEVKVFSGNSSLRRRLSKCNDIPVATIRTGLPLRKETEKTVSNDTIKNERALFTFIKRAIDKKYPPHTTKPMVDFIFKELDRSYEGGVKYDVRGLKPIVMDFASKSTHNATYCTNLVAKMHFCSKEYEVPQSDILEEQAYGEVSGLIQPTDIDINTHPFIFYDVEVYPNFFGIAYKVRGKDAITKLINPAPEEVEKFLKLPYRIDFNGRKYDRHINYARAYRHFSTQQLFGLSNNMINYKTGFIGPAYSDGFADIHDYSSKKQSLKKWEIDCGQHHQELPFDWTKPIPEDKWDLVMEYCANDVRATEAAFEATLPDLKARIILSDLTGLTPNDSTNQQTARLIFGNNTNPQKEFRYRNLAEPVFELDEEMLAFLKRRFPEMMSAPHGEANSLLPYFPNYKHENGVSTYRGVTVGEGGRVWAEPGMYGRVITFDVASQHPHSMLAEYLFGIHTEKLDDLVSTRVKIKHKDFDAAGRMFDGKLSKFLKDPKEAKSLSTAFKLAINSTYGLTAQVEKYDANGNITYCSPFRDPRNVDNIVAKRGALFMCDLHAAVEAMGGKVIHIKTDSIKVVDPSDELIEFILNFGKRYGYTFEVEHIFEKICLVNDAVYIAKCAEDDPEMPGKWTATGAQFAVPYVFKKLFSHEPIEFSDLCETKSVSGNAALYLDMNESLPEGEHNYTYVGRVGQFCPIKSGFGGGELFRCKDEKYSAAAGTKGYRWLESEIVKNLQKEQDIDYSYYEELANKAKDSISNYGDYEWFVS